jgi:hypothetical protein
MRFRSDERRLVRLAAAAAAFALARGFAKAVNMAVRQRRQRVPTQGPRNSL